MSMPKCRCWYKITTMWDNNGKIFWDCETTKPIETRLKLIKDAKRMLADGWSIRVEKIYRKHGSIVAKEFFICREEKKYYWCPRDFSTRYYLIK